MLSFSELPLIGYDPADVTINDLSLDQAVRILVSSRVSRRAVKDQLHLLKLPNASPDIEATLDAIRRRADYEAVKRAADAYSFDRVELPPTKFDAIADLRKQLAFLQERPDDFIARVAKEFDLDPDTLRAALEARIDPPASVVMAMLDAAGAQRVHFGTRRQQNPRARD